MSTSDQSFPTDQATSGFDPDPFASVPRAADVSSDHISHEYSSRPQHSDTDSEAFKLSQSRGVIVIDDISDLVSLVCGDDVLPSSADDGLVSSRAVHKSIHMYLSSGRNTGEEDKNSSSDEEGDKRGGDLRDDDDDDVDHDDYDEGSAPEDEAAPANMYVQLGDDLGGAGDEEEEFGDFVDCAYASIAAGAGGVTSSEASAAVEIASFSRGGASGEVDQYNTDTDLFIVNNSAASTSASTTVTADGAVSTFDSSETAAQMVTPSIKPLTKG